MESVGGIDGERDRASGSGGRGGASEGQGIHGVALVPVGDPAVPQGGQALARAAGGSGRLFEG